MAKILFSLDDFPPEILDLAVKKIVDGLKPFLVHNDPEEEFLTRNETARLLKISLPTLHDWTRTGKLKSYRISSRLRYRRSEVIEALEGRQAKKPIRR